MAFFGSGRTLGIDGDSLDPDAGGTRHASLQLVNSSDGSIAGSLSVTISMDGVISAASDGSRAEPATDATMVPEPAVVITAVPSPVRGTPVAPFSLPAGAVPVGWQLEAAAMSKDGRYAAVVTRQGDGSPPGRQLSVYRSAGRALQELWREVNDDVTLDENLAFADVNGDGAMDLVYETSFGGTGWTNWWTLAVSVTDDGARDVDFDLPIAKSAPSRPADLDGDGVYEWLAVDASWELRGAMCHPCSPSSEFVLAWDGHAYVDASVRFGDAIVERRSDPAPPASTTDCSAVDEYLSALVSRYLDYHNAGRAVDAERLVEALRAYSPPAVLAAKRDWIVSQLTGKDDRSPPRVDCPATP